MEPTTTIGDVVLRLLDGTSDQRGMSFIHGQPCAPFTLGSAGGWSILGASVASAHVAVAFNGERLFVAALGGELAVLDGVPLLGRWTEAKLPGELRFGGVRIGIGRRAGAEETTLVPPVEATLACELEVLAERAKRRAHSHEEITCSDPERLEAALRRSMVDEDVPRRRVARKKIRRVAPPPSGRRSETMLTALLAGLGAKAGG